MVFEHKIIDMIKILKNDLLTVEIDSRGAELRSIRSNNTGHEYLWQGDSRFWGRRSPVLFPIVGAVWDGVYRMDGEEFSLGQHGFARDMEFVGVEDEAEDEAWFALESDSETLLKFPRHFRLEIGYRLDGERITVMWKVKNTDSREMSFQIGAHPAFNYPEFNEADSVHGYFHFDKKKLNRQTIREKGCVASEETPVVLDNDGLLPIGADIFADDAIILAGQGVHRVSLLGKSFSPYLSLIFDAPLVGLWSPCKESPFVCIEPWWGRCDSVGYKGEFRDRSYVNTLAPSAEFDASYMIVIDNL